MKMDEIIIRKSGNTYIGTSANHIDILKKLPTVFSLSANEKYKVFEYVNTEWIHRASQSTRKLALKYDGDNRVLVWRSNGTECGLCQGKGYHKNYDDVWDCENCEGQGEY